jgi:hypothetical protein
LKWVSQLHRLQDLTGGGMMVGLVSQFGEDAFQTGLLRQGAKVLDRVGEAEEAEELLELRLHEGSLHAAQAADELEGFCSGFAPGYAGRTAGVASLEACSTRSSSGRFRGR